MHFTISDTLVSEFLSGLIVVFSLLGVGAILMLVLGGLSRKFPFTRMALSLGLAPLSLMRFLESSAISTLFFYSMIAVLLGITIDGLNHLLTPKRAVNIPVEADPETPEEPVTDEEPNPGMIVWEKAE